MNMNINNIYNVNNRKIVGKLSFDIGQVFAARVLDFDAEEILLKLLDGWQFSAKLSEGMEFPPKGLVRFKVDDFKEGKLVLSLVNGQEGKEEEKFDSIENALTKQGVNVEKEDYEVMYKMVKRGMPLTKENITKVKTMIDFCKKINDSKYEDEFLDMYIKNKNIDPNSKEGLQIKQTLKQSFNELKSLSEDELLFFFENDMEFSEENIKSFNSLFKKEGTFYKDVQKLKDANAELESKELNKEIATNGETLLSGDETLKNKHENKELNETNKNLSEWKKVLSESKEVLNKDTVVKNNDISKDEDFSGIEPKGGEKIDLEKSEASNKLNSDKTNIDKKSIDAQSADKSSAAENLDKKENLVMKNKPMADKIKDELFKQVKNEVISKNEEIKNIIKEFISNKDVTKVEFYDKILGALKNEMNDFKVLNSVSNQYYYMDLPLNVNESEYDCKLIIKDERNKKKKVDSRDVKIAASVSTNNMGVVDAYIRINNFNMEVEIKTEEPWIKILDIGKQKVVKELSQMGYNVYMDVKEREKEMNIVNCSEFFDDNFIHTINRRV